MKVILVTGSFPPMKGGVGDYTARLASALVETGEVELAVLTDIRASPTNEGLGFDVLPLARNWGIREIGRLARGATAWGRGIFHMQFPTQGYRSSWLPWVLPTVFDWLGFPIVLTWHEYWMGRFRFLPNIMALDGLVVVRPGHLDRLSRFYVKLLRHKHVVEIPNATALPRFSLSEAERGAVRDKYAPPQKRMVVYFGFAYPPKGIEQLFEIADPSRDHLVFICDLDSSDDYQRELLSRMGEAPWLGSVGNPGFLPSDEAARALAAADAVVLPFRSGGGPWNTSVHAAIEQGTFVLTTSETNRGYALEENCYYAKPGAVSEMKEALSTYLGRRSASPPNIGEKKWKEIAEAHIRLYRALVT